MSRSLLAAIAVTLALAGCGNPGGEVGLGGLQACQRLIEIRRSAPDAAPADELHAIGELGTGSASYSPDIMAAARRLVSAATSANADRMAAACEDHGSYVPLRRDGVKACEGLVALRKADPNTVTARALHALSRPAARAVPYSPGFREASQQLGPRATIYDTRTLASQCESHGYVVPEIRVPTAGS